MTEKLLINISPGVGGGKYLGPQRAEPAKKDGGL